MQQPIWECFLLQFRKPSCFLGVPVEHLIVNHLNLMMEQTFWEILLLALINSINAADWMVSFSAGSSASAASGVSQCLANLQSMQELMSEANLSLNAQILQSSPLDHQY